MKPLLCRVHIYFDAMRRGLAQLDHSIYRCFDAMKRGFQLGCGRHIRLDGCFLKEICKGQFLIVVVKDGNNQMLSIA